MEYFLGSAVTLLAMFITTRLILPRNKKNIRSPFRYRQSQIFETVKPLLPLIDFIEKPRVKRQSSNHVDKVNIRVIIVDSLAYWVKDNIFYVADIDGMDIQKDTARIVDTIHMDKVQLDKMLFIMDQLRDGKDNDSGSSGNR
jgi:hypothetical protein